MFISILKPYILLIRPLHWLKNITIFIPLLFITTSHWSDKIPLLLLTFILMSLMASAAYAFNDSVDWKDDASRIIKRNRPVANGTIIPSNARIFGMLLWGLTLLLSYYFVPEVSIFFTIYMLLNISYTFKFKHLWPLNTLLQTSFHILRITIGGMTLMISIPAWFYVWIILICYGLTLLKKTIEDKRENNLSPLRRHQYFIDSMLIVYSLSTFFYPIDFPSQLSPYKILCLNIFFIFWKHLLLSKDISSQKKRDYLTHIVLSPNSYLFLLSTMTLIWGIQ